MRGCFHTTLLATVSSAAKTKGANLFETLLSVLLHMYPGADWLDHIVMPCFNIFEERPTRFPQWLHRFMFLPTAPRGCIFSTSMPALASVSFFPCDHPRGGGTPAASVCLALQGYPRGEPCTPSSRFAWDSLHQEQPQSHGQESAVCSDRARRRLLVDMAFQQNLQRTEHWDMQTRKNSHPRWG